MKIGFGKLCSLENSPAGARRRGTLRGGMAPSPSSHPSFPVSTTGLRWGGRQGPRLEAGFPEQPPPPSTAVVQPSRPPCAGCGQKPAQAGAARGAAELGKEPHTGTEARESPAGSLPPSLAPHRAAHAPAARTPAAAVRRHGVGPSYAPCAVGVGTGMARWGWRQTGPILHLRAVSEPNAALMQAGSEVNCTNLGLFWALRVYLCVARRLLNSPDLLVLLFRDGFQSLCAPRGSWKLKKANERSRKGELLNE